MKIHTIAINPSSSVDNSQWQLAYHFVQYTNRNLFLTGKAGTGKTTFLKRLKSENMKQMVVVAPTGVAAINAGGVTIHSFFQMPFGPITPSRLEGQNNNSSKNQYIKRLSKEKLAIIRSMDLLVIDEISMVRADLLDGIDLMLKRYRKNKEPFGGVQLLMIGDLQQLPPVVKREDWEILKHHYSTAFFFSSKVFENAPPLCIELKHIYRQKDQEFINILNQIRENKLTPTAIAKLNERYQPHATSPKDKGHITLTTHNAMAQEINQQQLSIIPGRTYSYMAQIEGQFPTKAYPTVFDLCVKKGAQVMFVKNDCSLEKRYYNGKIGTVSKVNDGMIYVTCDDNPNPIAIGPEIWPNISYSVNKETGLMEEKTIGTFTQYPLRLAWAITIHKSQGLTFEKAIIDAHAAFAHGQIYVALSRCRSLEGLVLSSKISSKGIICDRTVTSFTRKATTNPPNIQLLQQSQQHYLIILLSELFNFSPLYNMVSRCRGEIQNHRTSVQGNLALQLKGMQKQCLTQMISIGNKFAQQIKQHLEKQDSTEIDSLYKERIKKASDYFMDRINQELLTPLIQSTFITDNQSLEKRIKELIVSIRQEITIKINCMESTSNGFNLGDFLSARAKAHLKQSTPHNNIPSPDSGMDVDHPDLYLTLVHWRNTLASEADVPTYQILPLEVIKEISVHRPSSIRQLTNIKGLGKVRISNHGSEIVEIVREYSLSRNLPIPVDPPQRRPSGRKNTRHITYEQFLKGRNIRQIATSQDLASSTIQSHLAHYVGTGLLSIHRFVEERKIRLILMYMKQNPVKDLKQVRRDLRNRVSFADLKFVIEHIKYLKSTGEDL